MLLDVMVNKLLTTVSHTVIDPLESHIPGDLLAGRWVREEDTRREREGVQVSESVFLGKIE